MTVQSRGVAYVLVAALVAISTVVIPGLVQWRLEAALHETLSADLIKVGVRGRPETILRGHVTWLTLEIRQAKMDGLLVDALRAEFSQVELDSPHLLRGGPLRLKRIRAGRASLVLTEDGIRRYLEQAGIRSARVRLADGLVTFEGTIPVLDHEFHATMRGRFAILEGRRVVLRVDTLSVSGVVLPPEVANVLITPLNPLLTVEELPIPLRLVQIAVDHGQLTLMAEPVS